MEYKDITIDSFLKLPQAKFLSNDNRENLQILNWIFPFKTNNYVIDELIDWNNYESDPIYQLNFPQVGMIKEKDFKQLENDFRISTNANKSLALINLKTQIIHEHISDTSQSPKERQQVSGIYHVLKNTALLFPAGTQSCHGYCNYCIRFIRHLGIGKDFYYKSPFDAINYLKEHPEIQDVIISGGDAFYLSAQKLHEFVAPLLDIESLQSIRFSSKVLTWWPYRFISDTDSDDLFKLFESIYKKGKQCSIMAHFSHPKELKAEAVKMAIQKIKNTGIIIRTQSPIVKYINDDKTTWTALWQEQIKQGLVPYYMFLESSNSLTNYFKIPIAKALYIFKSSQKQISGLGRTVRGPVYNSGGKKIEFIGTTELNGEKFFVLKVIQSPYTDKIGKIMIAHYDEQATDFDQLRICD